MAIEIIYCANGNRRMVQIAVDAGMLYGAQLPWTIYPDVAPLYFADQNWKRPNRERYMEAISLHRPHIATVLDLERSDQLSEVLDWAEEAAQFVEVVVIVPKCSVIERIPEEIGGKQIRLGYSVRTKFGATSVPVWEFGRRPVHLLGGSPHRQIEMAHYMNVVSLDGNYSLKIAFQSSQFWVPGNARYARNRHYPTLNEADGYRWGNDAPYEAFRRSCENIVLAWRRLVGD